MRIVLLAAVCVTLAGCDTLPSVEKSTADLRAMYEVGKASLPAPKPETKTIPIDIDVRAFDRAYETCRATSRGTESALAMAAARAAAGSKETHVVLDMGSTPQGKAATAAFSRCMSQKGYVNVR